MRQNTPKVQSAETDDESEDESDDDWSPSSSPYIGNVQSTGNWPSQNNSGMNSYGNQQGLYSNSSNIQGQTYRNTDGSVTRTEVNGQTGMTTITTTNGNSTSIVSYSTNSGATVNINNNNNSGYYAQPQTQYVTCDGCNGYGYVVDQWNRRSTCSKCGGTKTRQVVVVKQY